MGPHTELCFLLQEVCPGPDPARPAACSHARPGKHTEPSPHRTEQGPRARALRKASRSLPAGQFPSSDRSQAAVGVLGLTGCVGTEVGADTSGASSYASQLSLLLVGVFHRYHGNHFSNFTQRDRTHPPQETSQRQEPRQQSQSRTRVWRLLSYSAFDRNQEELHFIFSLEIGFFYQRNRAVLSLLHDRWHLC